MSDGGYDEGYTACPCFWGTRPAEMVLEAITAITNTQKRRALDLGCGEGKNAMALAEAHFDVVAIDTSEAAVGNAIKAFPDSSVQWLVADMKSIVGPKDHFDIVIATGSLHCLPTRDDIKNTIDTIKIMTKKAGINVIYSFNDGPQDMGGHSAKFSPTLLPHSWYLSCYSDWEILRATDTLQRDRHPHNDVDHHHSITRLIARRPK